MRTLVNMPRALKAVGVGPVPALSGKTDATTPKVIVLGRPRVAPLQSFFIRVGEPQDHGNLVVSHHQDTKTPRSRVRWSSQ